MANLSGGADARVTARSGDDLPFDVRAVLLDVDGTLVDSNDAHAAAWEELLRAEGHASATFERIRPLIGMGSDQLLPRFGVDPATGEGRALAEERRRLFLRRFLRKVRPLPGARELLVRLREKGLRLVIATSASGEELDPLLRIAGVEDLDLPRTTSDDAARSKPEPDVVRAALRVAGCRPDEALLIGDSPYDVRASAHAGTGTIALRSGGFTDEELAGALAIYDGPAHLLAEIDRSALAGAMR